MGMNEEELKRNPVNKIKIYLYLPFRDEIDHLACGFG